MHAQMAKAASQRRIIRCAIYTRKSSEEGLEQDFNSLHAQREACEAYVASQRHEGWKAITSCYDDGGFSGGSMERPGLQKLLADIHSGLIDVVVVYKVDRLTRSLTDFARIVETFDSKNVSFVSVTQSFNTTTSMGRLTLNVLLSFAQFEREVTGERIRDKIAASKKKGMWMGGFVPMGYAADGRSLQIVEPEAEIIRLIFDRFLTLVSVKNLKAELDRQGLTTRHFVSASNRTWGQRPFSIGHIRSILQNPIYVGEIRHKDERYPAQHPAIIDKEQFDRVQALIASRSRAHRVRIEAEQVNLLAGLLFDEQGRRYTSAHTSKKNIRYRYYVGPEPVGSSRPATRIPAGEIERLVLDRVVAALRDRHWLLANILPPDATPDAIHQTCHLAHQHAAKLTESYGALQGEQLRDIVDRIDIASDRISIQIRRDALTGENIVDEDQEHHNWCCSIVVTNPLTKQTRSQHLVIAPDAASGSAPPAWQIKALARGVTWYDELVSGRAESLREIAACDGVTERFVAQLIPLAFLEPQIIRDCIEGRHALSLTSGDISKGLTLPQLWTDQRT